MGVSAPATPFVAAGAYDNLVEQLAVRRPGVGFAIGRRPDDARRREADSDEMKATLTDFDAARPRRRLQVTVDKTTSVTRSG